jgi:hypothetical protein
MLVGCPPSPITRFPGWTSVNRIPTLLVCALPLALGVGGRMGRPTLGSGASAFLLLLLLLLSRAPSANANEAPPKVARKKKSEKRKIRKIVLVIKYSNKNLYVKSHLRLLKQACFYLHTAAFSGALAVLHFSSTRFRVLFLGISQRTQRRGGREKRREKNEE